MKAISASAVLSSAFLLACASPRAVAPSTTTTPSAPAPVEVKAAPRSIEWLPAHAPLVARMDVAALRELGLLPLIASALDLTEVDERALEAAKLAFLSVEPQADDARIVLVIDSALCVRRCEGFQARVEALGSPAGDLRAGLATAAPGLVVARAAVPRDASGDALREWLLESPVGVLSELRDAELRVMQRASEDGPTLDAALLARLANKGLANGLGLLLRDVTLRASDELEAVGLNADAQHMQALQLDVGEEQDAGDAMTVALDARISVPVASVPAVVLAFKKARERASAESLDE